MKRLHPYTAATQPHKGEADCEGSTHALVQGLPLPASGAPSYCPTPSSTGYPYMHVKEKQGGNHQNAQNTVGEAQQGLGEAIIASAKEVLS